MILSGAATARPNVSCGVCHARPRAACIGVDGLPLPGVHPGRDETTPIADAIASSLT